MTEEKKGRVIMDIDGSYAKWLENRLEEARHESYHLKRRNDKLERQQGMRVDFLGPGFRYRYLRSDGHVSAMRADEAREETIRWFAGQSIGRANSLAEAVEAGFCLWDMLEERFDSERAERKAAEEKADAEQDGDGDGASD